MYGYCRHWQWGSTTCCMHISNYKVTALQIESENKVKGPPHMTQEISSSLAFLQVSQIFNVFTEPHYIIIISFAGWFSYYSWAQKQCPVWGTQCPCHRDSWASSLRLLTFWSSLHSTCFPISASILSCVHNTKKLFTVCLFSSFTVL